MGFIRRLRFVLILPLFMFASCTSVQRPPDQPAHQEKVFHQEGVASWYGADFHGRETANGETYNMNALTAAHRKLPFDSRVVVTNLRNGKSVVVRINDRGPYAKGRIIDLSRAAARKLGIAGKGVTRVGLSLARND